jgi:hypothetical protein
MAILNYTTTVQVHKTVGEMHGILVQAGARQIATEYSTTGSPTALAFVSETPFGPRHFVLPADTRRVLAVMRRERVQPRYCSPEQAERVAWRILKDWLEAQLALIKIEMVTLDQVMLPYMRGESGQTVYDLYRDRQLALPAGSSVDDHAE